MINHSLCLSHRLRDGGGFLDTRQRVTEWLELLRHQGRAKQYADRE